MDLVERRRRFNLLKKEDEEMKEKCIFDYTVTESAQKVKVNLSDIGDRDDIINSLVNASRVSVYMYSASNSGMSKNNVPVTASVRVAENLEYFRLIDSRINKSSNQVAISIADRVSSDFPYFTSMTSGNMGFVRDIEWRELNKRLNTDASYLEIRVNDGFLVPQGTRIKVYVK